MSDDPFLTLVVESLNLMHPRFAAASGREYTSEEAAGPLAARKARERSFLLEFYHEVRHLWDQAFPVQLGLGHLVIQSEPELSARTPDLLFRQLGERGQPDQRLAALSLAFLSNPDAISADQTLLARYRDRLGYRYAVSIIVGKGEAIPDSGLPASGGVTVLFFDTGKWMARVVG